ncbi:MAG TPA: O-antigen ligase family protein, partial [Candidatus Binataceae bacterium]|nr:O-antigen ligase family protein [Candidatus Binataceae bacterium]
MTILTEEIRSSGKMPVGHEAAGRLLQTIGWTIRCGFGALIVLSPLAIGSVNWGALVALELTIFGLSLIWMLRSIIYGLPVVSNPWWVRETARLTIPLLAIVLLLGMQLIPIPPPLLRLVSPAAYRVYQVAFPGWPQDNRQPKTLSDPEPATAIPRLHFNSTALDRTSRITSLHSWIDPKEESGLALFKNPRWCSLTLSPAATCSSLLEYVALVVLFLFVLLYSPGEGCRRSRETFVVRTIYLLVGAAALIALLGILERAWWNGKILWFYRPTDWTGPLLAESLRASGPFVDPDHFANYLAMIVPLATAGALFRDSISPSRKHAPVRLFFGGAAVVMLVAIALSLSRGGWLAACVGLCSTLAIGFCKVGGLRLSRRRSSSPNAVVATIVVLALIIGVTLYFSGPRGRKTIATRITATSPRDFSDRVTAWRETVQMVKDFPLFGVGAGAWPEIFPHYQRPPNLHYYFFRTAENDYLQFVAETGFVGSICLILAIAVIIQTVLSLSHLTRERCWLFAALLGGIAGALVQELFDSSLHIPANALLFTILVGLLLRLALAEREESGLSRQTAERHRFFTPWLFGSVGVILILVGLSQDGRTFPYSEPDPTKIIANELVEHPAISAIHLAAARMMADGTEAQSFQVSAAVWLDPNDPGARDVLARNLIMAGHGDEGLAQLSESVYRAPFLDDHYYLGPTAAHWLLPQEQKAIAEGFNRAVDSGVDAALDQYAAFYKLLGREHDAAEAYERGAAKVPDTPDRLKFLLQSGHEYASLHEYASGGRVLSKAFRLAPLDSRSYAELAESIYAPQGRVSAATRIINQGISAGADPYALEMALAKAAEMTGNHVLAEDSLQRAVDYDPTFEALLELGRVCLAEGRLSHAIATLQRASELNPQSTEALSWLGNAYEASFDYYHAEWAFGQATLLAPADSSLREKYQEFRRRIAELKEHTFEPTTGVGVAVT